MNAQDLTSIVAFLAAQAAHLVAGDFALLNGWFVLGGVGLLLLALPRLVDRLYEHGRGLTRWVIDGAITAVLFSAYFIGMLAYGIFWVWLYGEIRPLVPHDARLYLAVGLVVAALVPLVWLVRALGAWFAALPGAHGPPRGATRRPPATSR